MRLCMLSGSREATAVKVTQVVWKFQQRGVWLAVGLVCQRSEGEEGDTASAARVDTGNHSGGG